VVPCDLDVTQPSFSSLSVSTVWCTSFSLHDHQLLLSGPSFSMWGRWNRGSGKRGSEEDSNQRISNNVLNQYTKLSEITEESVTNVPEFLGVSLLVLYKTAKFTRWRKTCCLLHYQTMTAGADDRLFAQVTWTTWTTLLHPWTSSQLPTFRPCFSPPSRTKSSWL